MYLRDTKLNVTPLYDVSHAANRDLCCAVQEPGMKGFLLCCMVVLNLAHGPDESDLRFGQIRDSMLEHFRLATPSSSPLSEQLAGEVFNERGDDVQQDEGGLERQRCGGCWRQSRCTRRMATG